MICSMAFFLHGQAKTRLGVTYCILSHISRPKYSALSALCSNVSTGPVDIFEVKRSQRHLLAAFENN